MNFTILRPYLFLALILLGLMNRNVLADSEQIRIGSKKFTENVILGDIASLLLQENDYPVFHQKELGGTRVLWEALLRGDIDVYPEYTGTLQFEILQRQNIKNWSDLQTELEKYGIALTRSLGFNNTYALGMRREHADGLRIKKISDLRKFPSLRYGLGHEFLERNDGWPGLKNRYQLPAKNFRGMDHDIAYRGIASKAIDVIDIYTTDAEIQHYDLIVLEDDLKYFPRYDAVYLFRKDLPAEVEQLIQKLSGQISSQGMIRMNASVKIDRQAAPQVAADFLKEQFAVEAFVEKSSLFQMILIRTKEHLFLVSLSMVAAIVIATPLGFIATLWKRGGQVILSAVGIIQTIPSLAILVIMIPLFGIGSIPALIALFLYSLLPIVRGTYLGFISIPQNTRELARAIGLSETARFYYIDWPLALSSILSGIKTSAVINVGTATLGAFIGAGGYGQTILKGIRLDDHALILSGAIPAAILALLVQWIFDFIEKIAVSKGLRL